MVGIDRLLVSIIHETQLLPSVIRIYQYLFFFVFFVFTFFASPPSPPSLLLFLCWFSFFFFSFSSSFRSSLFFLALFLDLDYFVFVYIGSETGRAEMFRGRALGG